MGPATGPKVQCALYFQDLGVAEPHPNRSCVGPRIRREVVLVLDLRDGRSSRSRALPARWCTGI